MASDVLMPRLSDSMEEGTVLKWLVEQGGAVKRGQPLVEIETDKANMTYEADSDGVLLEVLAKEGDTLPIGEPIARVGQEGEVAAQPAEDDSGRESAPATGGDGSGAEPRQERPAPAANAPAPAPAPAPATATEARPADPSGRNARIKASPVARRVAGELGVELGGLEGTGPGGRILKADVEAAAAVPGAQKAEASAAPPPPPPPAAMSADAPAADTLGGVPAPAETGAVEAAPAPTPTAAPSESGAKGEVTAVELTRLQRTVSRRMAESKATVPDFSLEVDVDMTLCIELRDRLKEQVERAPSYNDMVVKAAALALREQPRVNGGYRDGRFELFSRVNVGVAVAASDALVVPVIPDADQKSLGEISRQARRLIERVRDGEVTPPELSGGTFTVSNLGMFGIERFTAIINTPQAAILTVGALQKKPAIDERGRVGARDMMNLTLVCDHRILYGADGARFLARIRELLERPLSLAL